MLCYKDRTFCNAGCAAKSCRDRLTPAVEKGARGWWGDCEGEPPIAMTDMRERCPDFRPVSKS